MKTNSTQNDGNHLLVETSDWVGIIEPVVSGLHSMPIDEYTFLFNSLQQRFLRFLSLVSAPDFEELLAKTIADCLNELSQSFDIDGFRYVFIHHVAGNDYYCYHLGVFPVVRVNEFSASLVVLPQSMLGAGQTLEQFSVIHFGNIPHIDSCHNGSNSSGTFTKFSLCDTEWLFVCTDYFILNNINTLPRFKSWTSMLDSLAKLNNGNGFSAFTINFTSRAV